MNLAFLDPLGSLFSVSATFLYTQAHLAAWPVSLCAIIINAYLYWQKGIYAHLGLESVYLITSLYGWLSWKTLKSKKNLFVRSLSGKQRIHFACLWVVTFGVLSLFFHVLFDHRIVLDIASASGALIGQWLLCRRWIECWFVWFVVDALVVVLYWQKGIPFHSFYHFVYLFFAILGYLKWKKMLQNQSLDSTHCLAAPL